MYRSLFVAALLGLAASTTSLAVSPVPDTSECEVSAEARTPDSAEGVVCWFEPDGGITCCDTYGRCRTLAI